MDLGVFRRVSRDLDVPRALSALAASDPGLNTFCGSLRGRLALGQCALRRHIGFELLADLSSRLLGGIRACGRACWRCGNSVFKDALLEHARDGLAEFLKVELTISVAVAINQLEQRVDIALLGVFQSR